MIWKAEPAESCTRDAVREHLCHHLGEHIGGRITHPGVLEDVAAVLATAWQQDFNGLPLPPGSIFLMAARTMWGVGEVEAARALTYAMTPEAEEADVLLGLVKAGGPSLSACVGIGGGMVRPSRSAVSGDGPCWTLNLTCLSSSAGDLAELALPARVNRILTRTAEIWDETGGTGVLGISRPLAPGRVHLNRLFREEIPGICRRILERIQPERGWHRIPAICRLEL